MRTSYHVHTSLSDGRCTMLDHVRAAIDAGLDELGISDHYTLKPGDDVEWSMPESHLDAYFALLDVARREAGDSLIVRSGLEVDFFPEVVDRLSVLLPKYSFDYVIGSVHFAGDFPIDRRTEDWDEIAQDTRNEIIHAYWGLVKKLAESRLFDFAGHLDLYKKFGHCATIDLTQDIAAALDAIAAADMAVEVNASGFFKPAHEVYPSQSILRECFKRGIPSLVTTDAHCPEDLVRGYDQGMQALRDAGYTKQAVFEKRKRRLVEF